MSVCCDLHIPGDCCDPDDCGPCCRDCPDCPTLHVQRTELPASGAGVNRTIPGRSFVNEKGEVETEWMAL